MSFMSGSKMPQLRTVLCRNRLLKLADYILNFQYKPMVSEEYYSQIHKIYSNVAGSKHSSNSVRRDTVLHRRATYPS
jgi:hypothetical protein